MLYMLIYLIKNDFIFLSSLLKYENTLFLWHDDYIDSDFLQKKADEILNSKNKGYADTIIIPNSKLSEIPFIKSTSDAISSHYELKEYNRIVNEYFVANSIYGMIIPSILIKNILFIMKMLIKNSFLMAFFLLEILEECENKYTIRFEKKLHYLNNRMSSIPFKGQSWCDRSIFCDDFISLVKGIELILEHSTSDNIKISVKRSFFLIYY
ncbi:hypothetical protein LOJ97_19795 [Escherichia coli]|uniref:hypothetical protein n=1 Tax=Escherichia coli TaxID=562 RepID=UPI001E517409|nr:hypothetical protein [Escherichia coli]MCC9210263.1 hypothetical protein [Escherichia coli]